MRSMHIVNVSDMMSSEMQPRHPSCIIKFEAAFNNSLSIIAATQSEVLIYILATITGSLLLNTRLETLKY